MSQGNDASRRGQLLDNIHMREIADFRHVMPDAFRPVSVDISDFEREPVDPEDTIDPQIAEVFAEETARVACNDPIEGREKKVFDEVDGPWDLDPDKYDPLAGDPGGSMYTRCVG